MRVFRLGLAALAFGAVVSGCGGKSGALAPLNTTPAEAEAYIAKLATETFKGKATSAADIAAVRDALPKEISLAWGGLNFDAATGATVLTDVKLTPADMPNVGLSIAEVRLWDFDADFAKARLAGQRLTETASLARRIEAKSIAVFGLETVVAPAANSYVRERLEPFGTPEQTAELAARMETRLDNYEISIARYVLDDVVLRPYEVTPAKVEAGSELAAVMPILQGIAAAARTFAADTMIANGLTARMTMTMGGQPMTVGFGVDNYGARGMRGGDLDVAFLHGITMDVSAPNPTTLDGPPMTIAFGIDSYTLEKTRFDKLLSYLGKGEWPPRTDTNLVSLGLLRMINERVTFNGKPFVSVGEAIFDARDFHWLIPTKVRLSAKDVVYDIPGIMEAAPLLDPALREDVEGAEMRTQVMDLLARYDLSRPSLDYSLGWDWNPTSGATTIDGAFGLDKYMRLDAKFSGTMPSFKGVSDLIPGGFETADGEAIGQLFANVSNLKLIDINIVDEGGLDKGFALAVEIGKMMPVEPGQVDFFANQTPESLRQAAVALVYAGRDQAANQVPALRDLLSPFGAFVEKGGKVRVSYKPAKPLDAGQLEQIEIGAIAPADLLKDVKVEHTPPAGGPVKPN